MLQASIIGLLLLLAVPAMATSFTCSGAKQVAASYLSSRGERLDACFDQQPDTVTLRLPDASVIRLPVAVSGSGARYSDEVKTFWEHQGVGRYFVGEKLLFEGRPATAAGYHAGVTSKLLTKTSVTANGRKIVYPKTDHAEVTALIVDLAPGSETGWHKHHVPVYAYVQSGAIQVELEDGKQFSYMTGDPIIEVVDVFHNGRNNGTVPVRLVVFYLGSKDQPNVVRKP